MMFYNQNGKAVGKLPVIRDTDKVISVNPSSTTKAWDVFLQQVTLDNTQASHFLERERTLLQRPVIRTIQTSSQRRRPTQRRDQTSGAHPDPVKRSKTFHGLPKTYNKEHATFRDRMTTDDNDKTSLKITLGGKSKSWQREKRAKWIKDRLRDVQEEELMEYAGPDSVDRHKVTQGQNVLITGDNDEDNGFIRHTSSTIRRDKMAEGDTQHDAEGSEGQQPMSTKLKYADPKLGGKSSTNLEHVFQTETSLPMIEEVGTKITTSPRGKLTYDTFSDGPAPTKSVVKSKPFRSETHKQSNKTMSIKMPIRLLRLNMAILNYGKRSLSKSKVKLPPLLRFRRAVRTIITLLKATALNGAAQPRTESKLLSFTQYQDELLNNKRASYRDGLSFDPFMFKAQGETQISNEAKTILCLDPSDRTEDQLHVALLALNTAVDAFTEFPIKMQQSLVRVGWYEHFEAKRVIIRQGHTADNFYFILSGRALVTILETDKKTGEAHANTVATLKKGNSFGELALMHGAKRSATVTCKDDVELLAVGREDFIDIFMHVEKNRQPEHIEFLHQIDLLQGWPIERLPYDDPKTCLFTYFRRGVVMCRDSNKADWVYIIKTGSCKVLKRLVATTPNVPGLVEQRYRAVDDSGTTSWQAPLVSRSLHNTRASTSSLNGSVTNVHALSSSSESPLSPTGSTTSSRRDNNKAGKFLPPIRQKSDEEVAETLEQHRRAIDKIYKTRHETTPTNKKARVRIREQPPPPPIEPRPRDKQYSVFVEIQKLGAKQTFGLEHVAFSLMDKCTSVSLVSDGAEAILINKKFFLHHLTDEMRKKLRTTIQPYPSEESLQQKLQDMCNWVAFKSMTVTDHVLFNKYVQDTLYL